MTAAHHTTRCPNCQTAYRVTQEQLGAADGLVRCSKCLTTFNGIDCLVSRAPAPAAVQPPVSQPPAPQPPAPQPPAPQPPAAEPAAPDVQIASDQTPSAPAITANRDDDDDFLIDDQFDVSRLAVDEEPAEASPTTPDPDPVAAAPSDDGVTAQEETTEAPDADTDPFATDRMEPTFAASNVAEKEASAKDDGTPQQPATATAAAAPAGDESPDTGRQWPTIGWSAGIRSDKSDDDPILFTAGAPVAPLTEELDSLEFDKRAMSRWRPATHNLIPEAGLIGRQAKKQTLQTWLWFFGSVIAAATLAVQLIYFNSLLIRKNSPLSPLTVKVCETLGCPLPPSLDMDKILSTDLIIRSHPYTQDALLVDAVIVNTADFAQPFPPLTLAFEDLQGAVVARRTFTPAEYLMGELKGLADMPSRQPVKLELEIVDPGKDAVSFRLFIAK